ncbi:MAG TPA: double-strand break repair helicase AddA [Pseudolabrys sp.]|nr:double-strand break repair helicase AddA [Pseudolabrys sp.]
MNAPRSVPEAVIERQILASDPARSAWVSANAGSGKTHVLAQRVIRLLLAGVDPARILCITFTKAAAANMANKVFQDLRAWTVLDDAALDEAMRQAGVGRIDDQRRRRARRLFALALETPGGLKVQTIHAFCTQLLHLFPFEADVPARFEVLDESGETQMLEEIGLEVLLHAAEVPTSSIGRALEHAIRAGADSTFRDMLRAAVAKRDALTNWIEAAGGVDNAMIQLSTALNVGPHESLESIEAAIIHDSLIAKSEWDAIAAVLMQGSKTDKEQACRFQAMSELSGVRLLDNYLDIFCTTQRDKAKERVVTNAIVGLQPDLCRRLEKEQERVWDLLVRKRAIEARDRSVALFTIAYEVIERFRAEKNRHGLLDYEDLIEKTLNLLQDQRAAWVHYKLDRGIHHVLIDEAQDTSPKQWSIVQALVNDFFAGKGAHERPRTIFAVGDEKQSIFSFQGAAPRNFAAMRRHFEQAHQRAALDFIATEFKHSFRSGLNVLGAVDAVFARSEAHAGLTADPVPPVHEALPDKAPGLVEIWDLEKSDERQKVEAWAAPFDLQSGTSAVVKLARRIAESVAAWKHQGRRPKDVLILLRRRGALFEAIIRALKNADIEVAGADRLVLTEHIAAMDLLVLADALLLPDDDLALATVLKSPLFGLDDSALFNLAWNRPGTLYASLRDQHPEIARSFEEMREAAREKSPFEFYAWLLGPGEGRRKIVARLGHESLDVLDEFVNLALDYERIEPASLQGFVSWMRAARSEVKRDMEMDRDEVRVMTVHGAKGLEAPIVVLADTTTPPHGWHPPRLLQLPADKTELGTPRPLIWAGAKANDVGPMAAARAAALAEISDEYRRLLYVAMTRASERLIVCGVEPATRLPEGCWYELIIHALKDHCTREPADSGKGEVFRFRRAPDERAELSPEREENGAAIRVPSWLHQPLVADLHRTPPVRPSGSKAPRLRESASRKQALARGRLVHRLLQALPDMPRDRREKQCAEYLSRADGGLDAAARTSLTRQVMDILEDRSFAELYGPTSLAEVPIVGLLPVGEKIIRVSGRIDRLCVTENAVLIGDFKTDRNPARRAEDAPEGYVRQLAHYRAIIARLYPDRPVKAALIWTEIPELMELSSEVLDAALGAATSA